MHGPEMKFRKKNWILDFWCNHSHTNKSNHYFPGPHIENACFFKFQIMMDSWSEKHRMWEDSKLDQHIKLINVLAEIKLKKSTWE